ncbi:hypothetical protein ACFLXB_09465 [Chloroflexota bacterium]
MKNPEINFLTSDNWRDYELLDSGGGQKLERFGKYVFIRPEVEAIWKKNLPKEQWDEAHGSFLPTREESGGHWKLRTKIPEKWEMDYGS